MKPQGSVRDRLLADIISCQQPPGVQIHEMKAAARYDTSRTGLREAFVDLAARGFVHLEKNKGATVAPLDIATVHTVFEARIAVEKAAAALAAVRGTPEDIAALDAYRNELLAAKTAGDDDAYFAVDRAVHEAIAVMARNPFMASQVDTLRAHTARCWHYYRDRGLHDDADFEGLAAILSAIIEGRPQDAAEAMRHHLTRTLDAFNAMLTAQTEVLKWV